MYKSQQFNFYRTAVPQVRSSPIFSLQIDPLPTDPSNLVNNPILMMFDVVRKSLNTFSIINVAS